jgi:CDP-glucose 4,6-dehydratase
MSVLRSVFDAGFWRGRRVLVTGHTGFKGAWLTLWLTRLGARVTGFSLPAATDPSLFALCAQGIGADIFGDVTDGPLVAQVLEQSAPEIVIHMAAQALVRPSYDDPLGTFATNVMGTANVLQAVRSTPSVRAVVVVTSDKVYANDGSGCAFREGDRLGGHDPYSSSKACAELVVGAFRASFLDGPCRIATARAGNVIGGGDWAPYRIVHDLVAAAERGEPVALRYPQAVRAWLYVLDPLAGYLMLAQALIAEPARAPSALNFAPGDTSFRMVSELADAFAARWDGRPTWRREAGEHPHEEMLLTLDATHARNVLGWRPLLSFDDAVAWTADWYRAYWRHEDIGALTGRQIAAYGARIEAIGVSERSTAQ